MQWQKSEKNAPKDRQEVLISHGGHIHLAVYYADEELFVLRDGRSFHRTVKLLKWAQLLSPE